VFFSTKRKEKRGFKEKKRISTQKKREKE